MSRKRRIKGYKIGLPPGSAVYVGTPREGGAELRAMVYDSSGLVEHRHPKPEDVRALVAPGRVVWIDCDGVHDVQQVAELCTLFGVHPLAMEDALNTASRPKIDVYDNQQILLSLDMVLAEGTPCEILQEHVSLVVGVGFLLSFQEGRAGDLFDPVRQRIRTGTGRIRNLGADYLLHALVDAIVDGYFVVLDRMEERIDAVETSAFADDAPNLAAQVYRLKSELGNMRRSVFPLRELVNRMMKGETPVVGRAVEPYLRDLYDHVMQVLDLLDADRERLTSVLEVHLAFATHKMNDVMKVLTIVATVFIPLSWVAGVYGMNFDAIPELHWKYGYEASLAVMAGMAISMLAWFRHRRWL